MRFISVKRLALCAPSLLLVLLTARAQDEGPETVPADELQPVSLEGSRHLGAPVTDDDLPDSFEDLPPAPPSNEDRLRQLFKLYKDAVNDGMYAEADTLAKQIVELTIELNGLDSSESARAITNLAIAQHGAGDYESAVLNFNSAIGIIERISDRLNQDLINPLKGLGAAQLALGNPVRAAETYNRAMHISHVNYGPHNMQQVEVLESLAETFLSAGEYDQATDMQERIFTLQSRNIDQNSEAILPALYNQARWQHRLQMFDKERYTLRRIINVLEDSRGNDDISLISPLTTLGKSYLFVSIPEISYHQPTSNSTGEIYLKRALRIAEEHPDSDWETEAQALLALGDYYILTDRPSRAERTYRKVWERLSETEEQLRDRQDKLQTLTVLLEANPPKFYGIDSPAALPRRPEGFETGRVVFGYSVSARGRTTDIELIESEPAGLTEMERVVARELRRTVQRPRMVDGQSISTENLTFTHNFFYRPSDLPEATVAADADTGN